MNILIGLFYVFLCLRDSEIYGEIQNGKNDFTFDSYNIITDLEDYPTVCEDYDDESCAKLWLDETEVVLKRNNNRLSNINYRYLVDINKENEKMKLKFQNQHLKFNLKLMQKVRKFKYDQFQSPPIKRAFRMLTSTITSDNETVTNTLLRISQQISNIYNHARPCHGVCLTKGESGIVDLFATERNYTKLTGFWSSWRNETGRKIKGLFIKRMNLENIGAKENGYSDASTFQLNEKFEENNFNETVLNLYSSIEPLYKQLHGYVRYCLGKFYPNKFDKAGPIPAHILGNVWAQSWNNIMDVIQLCRDKNSTNSIQEEANKSLQTMSVTDMFRVAEEFYTSIGLYNMTQNFWERSTVTNPLGKLMDCHGSAHDFSNGHDYRIKMCTGHNINDFTTIHHEMGHIEYFMAYRRLPFVFQGSANPGFHEAIGDTIALSVMTPEHLKKIGFIKTIPTSTDFDIDFLLTMALEKVVFLPFALTMDSYIWSVYNGSVPLSQLNEHWWDLRYRFQGLKPPIQRTENDFDPAAKYHMAFGISYIRYFVSFIHQFQFYESMCKLSGYSGPLHRCDFYGSKEAGRHLLHMLEDGHSQHWRNTLTKLTGGSDISSSSLMRYFDPLLAWLTKTNENLNVTVGW